MSTITYTYSDGGQDGPARDFIGTDGAQYGRGTLMQTTVARLAELGVTVVETPNPEPTPEEMLDAAILAITAKYEAKKGQLQADILRCLTMDGENMETNLATLRAKWPTFAEEEEAEIMNLFI